MLDGYTQWAGGGGDLIHKTDSEFALFSLKQLCFCRKDICLCQKFNDKYDGMFENSGHVC